MFDGERIGAVRVDGAGSAGANRQFDADGLIVAPGFIDAQINGAHGIDVTAEPDRIGELGAELTRYGVTAFVPTVITCSPRRRADGVGGRVLAWSRGAVAVGLHLEGPMLAPARRGAHPEQLAGAPVVDGDRRLDT